MEKAGIIKDRVPVILGEVIKETLQVFERIAGEKKAPLVIASQKRHVMGWKWEKNELIAEVAEEHNTDHKVAV